MFRKILEALRAALKAGVATAIERERNRHRPRTPRSFDPRAERLFTHPKRVTDCFVKGAYPIAPVAVELALMGDPEILGAVDPVRRRVILNCDSPSLRERAPAAFGQLATTLLVEYLLDSGQGATILPELERYPPDQRRKIALAIVSAAVGMKLDSGAA